MKQFEDVKDLPTIGGVYAHFRGNLYRVYAVGLFCDNDHEARPAVVYQAEEGGMYIRSLSEWNDTVPGGKRRFERVG